ncbi:MAG: thiamine pyrophosphate-binding protein, partial [Stellaceae bacterium]
MSDQGTMSGAEWLARALAGTGMSHVFFVESVMRRTLLHLGDLGVKPILAHSEKAAAYMADAYARVSGRPGVCMAQSVGAANLASGLQDAWLGRSPVIALTGHKEPSFQHRNSYQEIAHAPLFSAVTKFSSPVYSTSELPRLLRHAWRAALADTPRPTHLDFNGLQGDVIELGQTAEPPVIEEEARPIPVHRPVADERDIERAAKILLGSRRLAIVAGDAALASGAGPE